MGRKYFGTDGVRGHVGEHPMTVEFALRLASAAARVLAPHGGTALVGKDTRLSGYMFEAALEAGFVAAGVNVQLIGPLPTPGIAYLTQRIRLQVRRRDQRLAQPLRRQWHQVLRRQRQQAVRRARGADRVRTSTRPPSRANRRLLGKAARVDKSRVVVPGILRVDAAEGIDLRGLKIVDRLRERRRATRWRRGCSPTSVPRSSRSDVRRTAATSTSAAARRRRSCCRPDGAGRRRRRRHGARRRRRSAGDGRSRSAARSTATSLLYVIARDRKRTASARARSSARS